MQITLLLRNLQKQKRKIIAVIATHIGYFCWFFENTSETETKYIRSGQEHRNLV